MLMKMARADLFREYGPDVNPYSVIQEITFQFSLHRALGLGLGLAGLAGALIPRGGRLPRFRWVVSLLMVMCAGWITFRAGYAVLRWDRFAPVPPDQESVDNLLYHVRYLQGNRSLRIFQLPRGTGERIPNRSGNDLHVKLMANGLTLVEDQVVPPGSWSYLLEQEEINTESLRGFIWMETPGLSRWERWSLNNLLEKLPGTEWYWVVETDRLVQGLPDVQAVPFAEHPLKGAFGEDLTTKSAKDTKEGEPTE